MDRVPTQWSYCLPPTPDLAWSYLSLPCPASTTAIANGHTRVEYVCTLLLHIRTLLYTCTQRLTQSTSARMRTNRPDTYRGGGKPGEGLSHAHETNFFYFIYYYPHYTVDTQYYYRYLLHLGNMTR